VLHFDKFELSGDRRRAEQAEGGPGEQGDAGGGGGARRRMPDFGGPITVPLVAKMAQVAPT
jgi:hypothetical protein